MKACRLRSMPWMMALTTGAAFGVFSCRVWSLARQVQTLRGFPVAVTYEGKPVTEGAVIFMPSDRTKACWGAGASSKTALS